MWQFMSYTPCKATVYYGALEPMNVQPHGTSSLMSYALCLVSIYWHVKIWCAIQICNWYVCALHPTPIDNNKTMSILTSVGWVAIFDKSKWIFAPMEHAKHHWKDFVSTHWLKWLPVNFKPAWLSTNAHVCGKCTSGLIHHNRLCSIIYGSFFIT